jgi:hypothetical protein
LDIDENNLNLYLAGASPSQNNSDDERSLDGAESILRPGGSISDDLNVQVFPR